METERIELDGGQWWEIKAIVTRGMRKAFRKAALQGFFKGASNLGDADLTDRAALQKIMAEHPEHWDLDAVDDAYLLGGTFAFSFGTEISTETIDAIPDQHVQKVLSRMRELYGQSEESLKN